ncbi:thyrostimulin alpha-2 subunit-like [Watersipora subatra]|uniref:thyrostimulin alpha-2 subunit-like n=1 Tax=Watersipora subatra TaxID=2589382 RepID=UPI00355C57DD
MLYEDNNSAKMTLLRGFTLLMFLTLFIGYSTADSCNLVGHQRRIKVPGCLPVVVTLNACIGYCNSYTIPMTADLRRAFPGFVMLTHGKCCSIAQTHDVTVEMHCLLTGRQQVVYKSAARCECLACR